MAAKRRKYGWNKPFFKDPLFWMALSLTAAIAAVQIVFGTHETASAWVGIALRTLGFWLLIAAVLRIRRGMSRALVDGYVEADEKAKAKPSGQSGGEAFARTSGRAVGKAIAAYKRDKS